ncbi:MAG: polysaccharide deacetylase family protein [Dehalococcoidia bacterium]
MDNTRYEHSAIVSREPIKWPNGARVAVWVIPNVEHFHIDVPSGMASPNPPVPDVRNFAWLDFGNRVGIWRIMEVLDKKGIRATVALNSEVCRHYPLIIEEGKRRGWEFMGHGLTNSRYLRDLPEDEEREIIRTVVRTMADATGGAPRGWLGPGLTETFNTPDILAEEGISYLCDWCCDDQPFAMKVRSGRLISVPYSIELNDLPAFTRFHLTPREFEQNIRDQFDVLYEEGAASGRVMPIALHPYLTGQAFRIGYLDRVLEYIQGHPDVWFATGGEIADWFYEHYVT